MPWYKTGTVKTTINSNAIIGTGTAFISNSRVGDAFRGPDGNWYEVINIASDTAMSISPNYQGPTVAAGAYSIAPMQGYVKESADRLRQTVESIGATLALFGGATNVTQLRTNIGAAQNGTNSDITNIRGLTTALSIAQGGTGANTAPLARTALGLGTAATYPVVGAGGIIERGDTANGEFTKFADGTLICLGVTEAVDVNTPSGGMFYNQTPPYNTYPHAFSSVPVCVGTAVRSGTDTSTFSGACEVIESSTSLSGRWRTYGVQAGRVYFRYLAIGRWKA